MGSLSDSLRIKGFYRTQSTAIGPVKITIGFTRIKTILRMTEEEIRKGLRNQSVGPIFRMREKEAGARSDQHHKKTYQRYTQFPVVSEEEESPARLGKPMQDK